MEHVIITNLMLLISDTSHSWINAVTNLIDLAAQGFVTYSNNSTFRMAVFVGVMTAIAALSCEKDGNRIADEVSYLAERRGAISQRRAIKIGRPLKATDVLLVALAGTCSWWFYMSGKIFLSIGFGMIVLCLSKTGISYAQSRIRCHNMQVAGVLYPELHDFVKSILDIIHLMVGYMYYRGIPVGAYHCVIVINNVGRAQSAYPKVSQTLRSWLIGAAHAVSLGKILRTIDGNCNKLVFNEPSPSEYVFSQFPVRAVISARTGFDLIPGPTSFVPFIKTPHYSHLLGVSLTQQTVARKKGSRAADQAVNVRRKALLEEAREEMNDQEMNTLLELMDEQLEREKMGQVTDETGSWLLAAPEAAPQAYLSKTMVADTSPEGELLGCAKRMGSDIKPVPGFCGMRRKTETMKAVIAYLAELVPLQADPMYGCLCCGAAEYVRVMNPSANPGHVIKSDYGITAAAPMAIPLLKSLPEMYYNCSERDETIYLAYSKFPKPEILTWKDGREFKVTEEQMERSILQETGLWKEVHRRIWEKLERQCWEYLKTRMIQAGPADKVALENIDIGPFNQAIANRYGCGPFMLGADTTGDYLKALAKSNAYGVVLTGMDASEFDLHRHQVSMLIMQFTMIKMVMASYYRELNMMTMRAIMTNVLGCIQTFATVIFHCAVDYESRLARVQRQRLVNSTWLARALNTLNFVSEFAADLPRSIVLGKNGIVIADPGMLKSGVKVTGPSNTCQTIFNSKCAMVSSIDPPTFKRHWATIDEVRCPFRSHIKSAISRSEEYVIHR
jgi:hypothetical protein